MDPNLQKKMYRTAYPPHFQRRLTPFLATSIGAAPGNISIASSNAMVPLHGTPLYNQTKNISETLAATPKDIISITDKVQNEQRGYGVSSLNNEVNKSDSEESDDIDSNSVKQVDPVVLSAFEKPMMKTKTINYTPKNGISADSTDGMPGQIL